VLHNTKQLYILDSYGADGNWNDDELNAPIDTRGSVEGQNWSVGYRMSTAGLTQSHISECTNHIFSLLQMLSNFSVDTLNMYMRKMFIILCFPKPLLIFVKNIKICHIGHTLT
jgi:hypothetical protein